MTHYFLKKDVNQNICKKKKRRRSFHVQNNTRSDHFISVGRKIQTLDLLLLSAMQ